MCVYLLGFILPIIAAHVHRTPICTKHSQVIKKLYIFQIMGPQCRAHSRSVSHYFQDVSRGVCDTGDGSHSPAVSLLIVMSKTLSSPRFKQPIKGKNNRITQ